MLRDVGHLQRHPTAKDSVFVKSPSALTRCRPQLAPDETLRRQQTDSQVDSGDLHYRRQQQQQKQRQPLYYRHRHVSSVSSTSPHQRTSSLESPAIDPELRSIGKNSGGYLVAMNLNPGLRQTERPLHQPWLQRQQEQVTTISDHRDSNRSVGWIKLTPSSPSSLGVSRPADDNSGKKATGITTTIVHVDDENVNGTNFAVSPASSASASYRVPDVVFDSRAETALVTAKPIKCQVETKRRRRGQSADSCNSRYRIKSVTSMDDWRNTEEEMPLSSQSKTRFVGGGNGTKAIYNVDIKNDWKPSSMMDTQPRWLKMQQQNESAGSCRHRKSIDVYDSPKYTMTLNDTIKMNFTTQFGDTHESTQRNSVHRRARSSLQTREVLRQEATLDLFDDQSTRHRTRVVNGVSVENRLRSRSVPVSGSVPVPRRRIEQNTRFINPMCDSNRTNIDRGTQNIKETRLPRTRIDVTTTRLSVAPVTTNRPSDGTNSYVSARLLGGSTSADESRINRIPNFETTAADRKSYIQAGHCRSQPHYDVKAFGLSEGNDFVNPARRPLYEKKSPYAVSAYDDVPIRTALPLMYRKSKGGSVSQSSQIGVHYHHPENSVQLIDRLGLEDVDTMMHSRHRSHSANTYQSFEVSNEPIIDSPVQALVSEHQETTRDVATSSHTAVCSTRSTGSTLVKRETVSGQIAYSGTVLFNEQNNTSTKDAPAAASVSRDVKLETSSRLTNGHSDHERKQDGGLGSGAASSLPLFYEQDDDSTGSEDDSIRKSTRKMMKRSVTFPLMPPSRPGNSLAVLQDGVKMMKIKPGSRHKYSRYFVVDEDGLTLQYTDSRKGALRKWWKKNSTDFSKVKIRQIVKIIDGPLDSSSGRRLNHHNRSNSFTLVIGELEQNFLTLVAPTLELKTVWMDGLRQLMAQHNSENPVNREKQWLYEQFNEADVNKDGYLDADEILKLLQRLSFCPLTTNQIKQQIKKQTANRDEFVEFYQELSRRKEIEDLFDKYVNGSRQFLGPHELCEFFLCEQNEKIDIDVAGSIIDKCEPYAEFKEMKLLTLTGFYSMMASKQLNIRSPRCRSVYQDMTQPLSHYFISSSHNTYLEGNQLTSNSSVAQYKRVLALGCRCVELDVWDGDHGEPIVYHGYTMTSKIKFREALVGIAESAFVKSPYPVILSLENHCSVEQQKQMAGDLREVFGERLFVEPIDENQTTLPSPEQLKYKIIVKGKKLPAGVGDDEANVSDEDEAAEADDEDVRNKAKKRGSSVERKNKLAVELSNCIVICQSASFKSFEISKEKLTFAHISSFDEEKAMKLANDEAVMFVRHNARQLSRTYPAGKRTNSSNYDPVPLWNVGCQVVALNFQTMDEPMLLNYGRFQDNGNCGYVLKPEFMRSRQTTFDCHGLLPASDKHGLTVRIISGYILPKKSGDSTSNILDPYVQVEVFGVPADCRKQNTLVIADNGFNPRWDEELSFTITCPELALVMFRVVDQEKTRSDVTVAHYCLPFKCMQTGYRMVALRDRHGNIVGDTSLFVHIRIEQSIESTAL